MKNILKSFVLCGLIVFCTCCGEKSELEPFNPLFSVPAQVNKINTKSNDYSISVTASDDVSWSAALPTGSSNEWITLESASGKGNGLVGFNLEANEGRDSRSVEVIFTASSDRSSTLIPSQVCVVTQIGTAPAIEIYPNDEETVPVTANPDYLIAVTSNVEWMASVQITSGSEEWISLISPETPVTGEGEVKLNILENTSVESRVAVVTVVSTENPTLMQMLTITQSGIIPSLELSPTGSQSISDKADNAYTVAVTSNIEWEASLEIAPNDDADWITVASPAGTFMGNGNIILDVKANSGTAARTAVLHVKSTAFPTDNTLNKTLTITQINAGAGFVIFIADYTALTTGPATMNVSPYPSGAVQNVDIEVTSDESGATIDFSTVLSPGRYSLNSVSYDSEPSVNVGAIITINDVGMVTVVEHWDPHFNLFGGTYEDRPIQIASSADLIKLRDVVNEGNNYPGIIFKQTASISLSGEWEPIGNASGNTFRGIYDGNNNTISGLYMSSGTGKALFGNIGGVNADSIAVIKNLTVEGSGGDDADISSDGSPGTSAGVAAIVTANTLIENCINRAHIAAPNFVGGLVGTCTGDNITIKECINYGKILGAGGVNAGIVASISSAAEENIYITSCHNYGDLKIASTGNSVTGGIVGRSVSPTSVEIKWCSNRGNISLDGVNATNGTGGIVGSLLGNGVVQECFNLGQINTFTNTGGIVGFVNNTANKSRIINCYNKGTILYTTRTAVNNGAIAGNATNYWTIPIEYCYNAGATHPEPLPSSDKYAAIVSANNIPGGVLTAFSGVKECFYETGLGYLGGLGGNVPPGDVAGATEGKTAEEMKSIIPYTGNWSAAVWQFTAGQYPALKNNPE